MSPSLRPLSGRVFRIVPYKCCKCGKEHGVKHKDGVPVNNNFKCRRCGSLLVMITGNVTRSHKKAVS